MDERDRQLEVLAINRAIAGAEDYDDILRLVVERTAAFVGASACVLLLSRAGGLATVVGSKGIDPEKAAQLAIPLTERVDVELQERLGFEASGTFVSVPVIGRSGLMGVLAAYRPEPPSTAQRHEEILSAFADQAAIALDHADRVRRLREARDELASEKRLLETVMEASPAALMLVEGPGARVTYANPPALALYGAASLVGEPLADRTSQHRRVSGGPCDTPELPYVRAIRGERVRDQELLVVLPDGRSRVIEFHAEPVAEGGTRRAVVAALDVTARQRAEAELRRVNRAYRALSRCNQAVARASDETELLGRICRIVVEEAGYRFCWVGRAEHDEAKTVWPIAQAGFEEGYLERARISWAEDERGRGPTGTSIRERRPVVARDIASDPRFGPWRADALQRGYASSIAIPLSFDQGTQGAMSIYAAEPDAFDEEETRLLCELADDLAFGVSALRTRAERDKAQEDLRALNARLEERVAARTEELRAAREREAETGGKIQRMLLLDEPPRDVRGLRIAALTVPSERIAGDFYGFFRHEDNDCFDVIVADVMGKGVPAALLGAATKSHFPDALWHLMGRVPKGSLPEPKDIVTLAHTHMARHLIALESFVTSCYARFDVANRRLDFVDCAHTGVLHLRRKADRCTMLHGRNLALGIHEGEIYDQLAVPLETDDIVLFFSDGVTEARNAAGEMFGPERLVECVRRNAGMDPAELVSSVHAAAAAFASPRALTDDLTCVVVQLVPEDAPIARAELELRSALRDLKRAREFVAAFCTTSLDRPLREEALASLVLAVNEAASNVMKHAYHGREDQRIEIAAEAFRDRVSIRLRHLGAPFDAAAVPPPCLDGSRESGFGVFLIAQSVDRVRYYRDDLERSCIQLEIRRQV